MARQDQYRRMSDDMLGEHLAWLHARQRPETTIGSRRVALGILNRYLPFGLAYATREQIDAWLSDLRRRGRAKATIRSYQYHAGAFYEWATLAGYLPANPMEGIEIISVPLGVPSPVSEDELARLLSLAEPLHTAIVLGAFAGLRRAEVVACRREHITETVIVVPHGKGDQPGTVPTHPYVWGELKDRPPGPLITDKRGRQVSPNWLSKNIRYACDAIGLPNVHFHLLRHRYGTAIQELYGDLRVTQECLRHKHVSSTQRYTLVTPGRRAAAVTQLPVPPIAEDGAGRARH